MTPIFHLSNQALQPTKSTNMELPASSVSSKERMMSQ